LYESTANQGDLAYEAEAYLKDTGRAEVLSRYLNEQVSYRIGIAKGVFDVVTGKPLCELAGMVETSVSGNTYIRDATKKFIQESILHGSTLFHVKQFMKG